MKLRYYTLDNSKRLLGESDSAPAPKQAITSWIDIHGYDIAGARDLLQPYGLHDLVTDAMDSAGSPSHIGYYKDALLVQLPVLDSQKKREFLSIIISGELVISIHDNVVPALDRVIERCRTIPLRSADLAILVYEMLDQIVDDSTAQSLVVRKQVDKIEQQFDESANSFDPNEVTRVRRSLMSLEGILDDQHRSLAALQTMSVERLQRSDTREYSRDLLAHLDHSIRVVGRLADRLSIAQQHYLLTLEEHQNQRLNVLAIVSAIFLPLTLITGIYGMNFANMPELTMRYGYPVVLGAILVLGGGLAWLMRKKGWYR